MTRQPRWPRDAFIEAVWKAKADDLSSKEKLVLLCYARHAAGSDIAWVSWPMLMAETSSARDTVNRVLRSVEAKRWLLRVEKPTQHRSARYKIVIPTPSSPIVVRLDDAQQSDSRTAQQSDGRFQQSDSAAPAVRPSTPAVRSSIPAVRSSDPSIHIQSHIQHQPDSHIQGESPASSRGSTPSSSDPLATTDRAREDDGRTPPERGATDTEKPPLTVVRDKIGRWDRPPKHRLIAEQVRRRIRAGALPLDLDELMLAAYDMDRGDPWRGYGTSSKRPSGGLDSADPAADLRSRLAEHRYRQ